MSGRRSVLVNLTCAPCVASLRSVSRDVIAIVTSPIVTVKSGGRCCTRRCKSPYDASELQADGTEHLPWPGPETFDVLHDASTASSGRNMTRLTSGFTYAFFSAEKPPVFVSMLCPPY